MALSITIQMPFWTVWETVRQPVMMSGSPSLQWLVRYSKTGLIVLILCWFIRFKTSKQRFVRLVVVQFRGRGRRLGGEADDVSDIDTRVSQLAAVTQISHNKGIRSASTPCLLLLMPLLMLPSSLLLTLSSNIQPHLTSIIPPPLPPEPLQTVTITDLKMTLLLQWPVFAQIFSEVVDTALMMEMMLMFTHMRQQVNRPQLRGRVGLLAQAAGGGGV